jgi:Endonuclease/Exonuclease/phosphatase family.
LLLALRIVEQPSFSRSFWNAENLFDCRDDLLKNDYDFLPDAPRHWTFFRYRQKLINLSKVVVAAGEGELPALVGLCEIENDSVMKDLYNLTPFRELGYRHIITHSPDERGINVALLYQRSRFRLLNAQSYHIAVPNPLRPTRDILHVVGQISRTDTLDVFICHFPSRSGGEKRTRPARQAAYKRLKSATDSIIHIRSHPYLLIMGDFNDSPLSKMQVKELQTHKPTTTDHTHDSANLNNKSSRNHIYSNHLYNLMSTLPIRKGSYKYKGVWEYLDQFLINGNLLSDQAYQITFWQIFSPSFLQTEDTRDFGIRPFRTYYGYKYEGGYSDHFPILLDIQFKKKRSLSQSQSRRQKD